MSSATKPPLSVNTDSGSETSFISRLPDELLAEIFSLAKDSLIMRSPLAREPLGSKDQPHWTPFPIRITDVSLRWRNIAFTIPSLWSQVSFADTNATTELFLARSGTAPLDMIYDAEAQWTCPDEDACPTFTRLLEDPALRERWRTLWYRCPEDVEDMHYAYAVVRAVPQLSNLEDLLLSFAPTFREFKLSESTRPPVLKWGEKACSLESLRLHAVPVKWDDAPSWAGLTCLELKFFPSENQPTFPQLRHVLETATHLRELVLDAAGPHGGEDAWDAEKRLTLPHLRKLALARQDVYDFVALLKRLVIPELHHLELNLPRTERGAYPEMDDDDDPDDIFSLIVSNPQVYLVEMMAKPYPGTETSLFASVRVLRVEELHFGRDTAAQMLSALPQLEVICVDLDAWDTMRLPPEFMLCVLGLPPDHRGRGALLPRLTTLLVSALAVGTLWQWLELRSKLSKTLPEVFVPMVLWNKEGKKHPRIRYIRTPKKMKIGAQMLGHLDLSEFLKARERYVVHEDELTAAG